MKFTKNTTINADLYQQGAVPLMKLLCFDEYSAFVEHLIRQEMDRRRPDLIQLQPIQLQPKQKTKNK